MFCSVKGAPISSILVWSQASSTRSHFYFKRFPFPFFNTHRFRPYTNFRC